MCMCMLLACACACYLPTTVCLVISNMLAWLIKVSRTGILSVGYTDFAVPSRPNPKADHHGNADHGVALSLRRGEARARHLRRTARGGRKLRQRSLGDKKLEGPGTATGAQSSASELRLPGRQHGPVTIPAT